MSACQVERQKRFTKYEDTEVVEFLDQVGDRHTGRQEGSRRVPVQRSAVGAWKETVHELANRHHQEGHGPGWDLFAKGCA
jgi:hypothetical protein